MKVANTQIHGMLVLEPKVIADERGSFFESYNQRRFCEHADLGAPFVQENQSRSVRHALRGLHYQVQRPQGKLVRALSGRIFDVAVDLRRSSPTFLRWARVELTGESYRMCWIPPGCAHGFVALSDHADVLYKVTDYWSPEHERTILWCDPDLAIDWQLESEPILSAKDRAGRLLRDSELYP
jgi:dTDP-4-dehydrorhamnose 3,5-epimerase